MANEQKQSEESRVRVQYTGPNKKLSRVTVNGRRYPFDVTNKDGVLLPLGDATALVTGEPKAFRFASETRQADIVESYPVQAESVDTPTLKNDEGGRAVSENANPSGFRRKS